MKKLLPLLLIVTGCAANSGVVQMGPDSYMVSRQAASGFSGSGTLKAEALQEAGQFCTSKGKTVEMVSSNESKPPYVFGNFPKAEIHFHCI